MTAAVAAPDDGSGGGPGPGASTVEYTCPICGYASSDKHCFHYGGVSCYSCRAFFRRAHQVRMHGCAVLEPKTDFIICYPPPLY